jgi:hypothetical protein
MRADGPIGLRPGRFFPDFITIFSHPSTSPNNISLAQPQRLSQPNPPTKNRLEKTRSKITIAVTK